MKIGKIDRRLIALVLFVIFSVWFFLRQSAPPAEQKQEQETLMAPEARFSPTPDLNAPPLRELAERRGFWIGAAVSADVLKDDAQYAATLAKEFNLLTPENVMKFELIHPQRGVYDFSQADELVKFAEEHGMRVRGHTLVWHQQVPKWVSEAQCEELEAILHEHILSVAGRYRGRVWAWDVVNEALEENGSLRNTLWKRCLGEEYIAKAFRWAHEADPQALLFYNDYNIEWPGRKSEAALSLAKDLLEQKVPIHGIGLQMHLENAPSPRYLEVYFKQLADLGLQVHITELDVRLRLAVDAEKLAWQAGVYRDVLMVCRQAENCSALVMWGFTDRYSWIPYFFPGYGAALIFDAKYQPKPAYWELSRGLGE